VERSTLFVPAIKWPMVEKAASSAADSVCVDLEDSVQAADKVAARENAVRAFRELPFRGTRILRVNGLDTAFTYRDFADVIEHAGDRIDLVMLPKAGSASDVAFADTMLSQIERAKGFTNRIGIEAQIETAAGFLSAREIAAASPRLEALIFGPGDFAASMGMPAAGIGLADEHDALYPGHRWHAVMHTIVAAARANGLRAIDGPFAAFKDAAAFEQSCRIARAMGFDGKQCIHPSQLETANTVFAPSPGEIEHARRMVDAYQRGAAQGSGAVSLDGTMVDEANVRLARVVLQQHARVTGSEHTS
jgi:citrate lyase subunit beta/citryl-CoA lyase